MASYIGVSLNFNSSAPEAGGSKQPAAAEQAGSDKAAAAGSPKRQGGKARRAD